jgi:hypothetical protein
MDGNTQVSTYSVTIESNQDLGVKPDFLISSYNTIWERAKRSAPKPVSHELVIAQDGKLKTVFHIKVSNRMAPYLIKAIQDQMLPEYGIAFKSYWQKVQEQVMAQMFSDVGEISFPKFG